MKVLIDTSAKLQYLVSNFKLYSFVGLPEYILNVLGFDVNEQRFYALHTNKQTYLKSLDSQGISWAMITKNRWDTAQSMVIKAVDVSNLTLTNDTNIEKAITLMSYNSDVWSGEYILIIMVLLYLSVSLAGFSNWLTVQ